MFLSWVFVSVLICKFRKDSRFMWKTMDEETLKSKKVVELKEIAKTFGLKGYQKMKKAELVAALMKDEPDDKKDAAKAEAAAPKKGRKAAGGSSAVKSAATAVPAAPETPAPAEDKSQEGHGGAPAADNTDGTDSEAQETKNVRAETRPVRRKRTAKSKADETDAAGRTAQSVAEMPAEDKVDTAAAETSEENTAETAGSIRTPQEGIRCAERLPRQEKTQDRTETADKALRICITQDTVQEMRIRRTKTHRIRTRTLKQPAGRIRREVTPEAAGGRGARSRLTALTDSRRKGSWNSRTADSDS